VDHDVLPGGAGSENERYQDWPRYRTPAARSLEAGITIGELGEFGLIAAIAARMPPAPDAIVGIGDDAAVLRVPDPRIVATTDLLVEARHFRTDWSGPADIGGKAAAQNLADVAAMGAVPTALLVGLAAPSGLPVAWAEDLASGLAEEAARAGAYVVGGDVSEASLIMLAVTAIGTMAGRDPVTRSGARPSDVVAAAGRLGHSAAGLALLQAGRTEPADAVQAHRRPQPPYRAGPEAAVLGATAMIDVSDGLLADLGHIAAASSVAIDVDPDVLAGPPMGLTELAAAAEATGSSAPGEQALSWALTGGEDHSLVAAFPPGVMLPARWTVIGVVRDGRGVLVGGQPHPGAAGWDHFRSP
jgi:thiamine-monophosphate kinase